MKKQFKKGDECYIIRDVNFSDIVIKGTVADYHTMKVAQRKWLANRKNRKDFKGIGYGWPDQDMVQVTYLKDDQPVFIWREVDSVKKNPNDFLTHINT